LPDRQRKWYLVYSELFEKDCLTDFAIALQYRSYLSLCYNAWMIKDTLVFCPVATRFLSVSKFLYQGTCVSFKFCSLLFLAALVCTGHLVGTDLTTTGKIILSFRCALAAAVNVRSISDHTMLHVAWQLHNIRLLSAENYH